MFLQKIEKANGWMVAQYQATWKYGYQFMLDAAQAVIDSDFKHNLSSLRTASLAGVPEQEQIDSVRKADNILQRVPEVSRETGVLIVSGTSQIMECLLQLNFYNQTNVITLYTPSEDIFKKGGDNAFSSYISSIEIKAYCADTKRNALRFV